MPAWFDGKMGLAKPQVLQFGIAKLVYCTKVASGGLFNVELLGLWIPTYLHHLTSGLQMLGWMLEGNKTLLYPAATEECFP